MTGSVVTEATCGLVVLVQVIFFDFEHRLILDRVMFPPGNRVPFSPTTGQPFKEGEQRSEINHRKPAIQRMVALAGIKAYRATVRQDGSPIDIDVLNHLWELETKRVSARLPVDVMEEAIGVYRDDQVKSRFLSWDRLFSSCP